MTLARTLKRERSFLVMQKDKERRKQVVSIGGNSKKRRPYPRKPFCFTHLPFYLIFTIAFRAVLVHYPICKGDGALIRVIPQAKHLVVSVTSCNRFAKKGILSWTGLN